MRTELARRLLAHETVDDDEHVGIVAGRVHDKLHAHISPIIGMAGMRMIWTRSTKLAQSEFEWLEMMTRPEGAVGLRECLLTRDNAGASAPAVLVFATFLRLLATLIGERLMLQIIRMAWPTIDETPREENTT